MTIYSVALAEYLPERDSPTLKTSITPPVFFFFLLMKENIPGKHASVLIPRSYLSFSFVGSLQRLQPYTSNFSQAIWICSSVQSQILTHKLGVVMVERQSQGQIFQALDLISARCSGVNCLTAVRCTRPSGKLWKLSTDMKVNYTLAIFPSYG